MKLNYLCALILSILITSMCAYMSASELATQHITENCITITDPHALYNQQDGSHKELLWRLQQGFLGSDAQQQAGKIAARINMQQLFEVPHSYVYSLESGQQFVVQQPSTSENFLTFLISYGSHGPMEPCVRFLLDNKVDPNDSRTTATALLLAARKRPQFLEVLLEHGADPNQPSGHLDFVSQKGDRPLHALVREFDPVSSVDGSDEMEFIENVRVLLNHGASLAVKNDKNEAPVDLFNAKRQGSNTYQLTGQNWDTLEAFLKTGKTDTAE